MMNKRIPFFDIVEHMFLVVASKHQIELANNILGNLHRIENYFFLISFSGFMKLLFIAKNRNYEIFIKLNDSSQLRCNI